MIPRLLDDDGDDFEALLAQLPLPSPTSLSGSTSARSSFAPPTSLSTILPPLAPRQPPSFLGVDQLVKEWDNVGKDVDAGSPLRSDDVGRVFFRLTKALYEEAQLQRRRPSSGPEANGTAPFHRQKRDSGAEGLGGDDGHSSAYIVSLQKTVEAKLSRGEDASVLQSLLDELCTVYQHGMQLLQLNGCPLIATPATPPSSPSSLTLSSSHLLHLASMAHNLALLSSSLYLDSHCLYFSHYALALSTRLPSPNPALPVRTLRLLLLTALCELAHRARPLGQGLYGEAIVREAQRLRDADASHGSQPAAAVREDRMPAVLELQGRLYVLSGMTRYLNKQTGVGKDVSQETYDLELRVKAALDGGKWDEKHCELLLDTALQTGQRSVVLQLLAHLLRRFPSPAAQRQQLLCAVADDAELFVHCTGLLAVSLGAEGFVAVRFMTEDCWTRGVLAARRGEWEEGERLLRLGLQMLQRSTDCTDRPEAQDGDEVAVEMMEGQLAFVRQKRAQMEREAEQRKEEPQEMQRNKQKRR